MSTLYVSLRCLKHPATVLCIGLLLANDHWLKASFSSWWTGKLSDFGGLFFFPFLIAPPLALLLDRKHLSPTMTGYLAFGLTAIWFALLKTWPLANAVTSALLAALLGHPVQLVLDPTDLIALPVLVPAWLLWRQEAQAIADRPSRRAWLALALGVLATLATSPLPPVPSVQRLVEDGGRLYAYRGFDQYDASGRHVMVISDQPVAFSADGGRIWNYASSSTAVSEQPKQATLQACDPGDVQLCYRIRTEQVEESHDAGRTYQTAWSIPWGRRYFMQRESQGIGLEQRKQLDIGPYDFIFTKPVGANGLSTVMFALGSEGVLVRRPDGIWERQPILDARPTPFSAKDLYDTFRTIPVETDVAGFLVLLTFSFLSLRAASRFKGLGRSDHSVDWATGPLVAVDALMLTAWGVYALYGSYGAYPLGPFWFFGTLSLGSPNGPFAICILIPVPVIILLGILLNWTWERIAQLAPNPDVASVAFRRTVVISVGMALATLGPLVLWTVGVIPLYELAVAVAVVLAVVLVRFGIKRVPGE